MTLPEFLALRRISVQQFAVMLGVHQTTVYRLLNGQTIPVRKHLKRILAKTDGEVSVKELLTPVFRENYKMIDRAMMSEALQLLGNLPREPGWDAKVRNGVIDLLVGKGETSGKQTERFLQWMILYVASLPHDFTIKQPINVYVERVGDPQFAPKFTRENDHAKEKKAPRNM